MPRSASGVICGVGAVDVIGPGDVVVAINGMPAIGLGPMDLLASVRRRGVAACVLAHVVVSMAASVARVSRSGQARPGRTTVLFARVFAASSFTTVSPYDVIVRFRPPANEGGVHRRPGAPHALEYGGGGPAPGSERCVNCSKLLQRLLSGRLCASCTDKSVSGEMCCVPASGPGPEVTRATHSLPQAPPARAPARPYPFGFAPSRFCRASRDTADRVHCTQK